MVVAHLGSLRLDFPCTSERSVNFAHDCEIGFDLEEMDRWVSSVRWRGVVHDKSLTDRSWSDSRIVVRQEQRSQAKHVIWISSKWECKDDGVM